MYFSFASHNSAIYVTVIIRNQLKVYNPVLTITMYDTHC